MKKKNLVLVNNHLLLFFCCYLFSVTLDFANLPYLFDGDVKITQSKAILYYLGRKLNLMGKSPKDEAYIMMLCEQAHDFRMQLGGIFYGPKGESEDERKQFVQTTVNENFQKFDNYFGKHKTKFAVGDQPTVADFQLYDYIDAALILEGAQALLDKYTNIKQFLTTIQELPELKDYIAKAHAELPINNKGKLILKDYLNLFSSIYFSG